jgi:hypothetical protein
VRPHDPRRGRRRSGVARTGYAWECLSRLARILVRCGHSPQDLVSALREICGSLKVPRRGWDPAQLGFVSDLPHVIALWHSDPRYLDARGEPAALPLRGRGRSLTGLIKWALPGEDPRAALQALEDTGGLGRRGARYVPTGRHLWLREDSGRVHSANALLRMLRTVERNLAGAANSAIFERAATNPRFPVAKLPAFHRDMSARAEHFLVAIDGNMRRQEARTSGGPRTRVGVEVFDFEDPPMGGRRAHDTARSRRMAQHGGSTQSRPRRRKP